MTSLRPFLTKLASALTVAIANITYLSFGILQYTNGISDFERAANAGEITDVAKAEQISALLENVQNWQSFGLLCVMIILPLLLMLVSYILYKKHYKLDEDVYEDICRQLAEKTQA